MGSLSPPLHENTLTTCSHDPHSLHKTQNLQVPWSLNSQVPHCSCLPATTLHCVVTADWTKTQSKSSFCAAWPLPALTPLWWLQPPWAVCLSQEGAWFEIPSSRVHDEVWGLRFPRLVTAECSLPCVHVLHSRYRIWGLMKKESTCLRGWSKPPALLLWKQVSLHLSRPELIQFPSVIWLPSIVLG